MFDIKVERIIKKDINTVFEILVDHQGYNRFRGVAKAELLTQGSEEKNGLGALRLIDLGAMKLHERISHFQRPTRYDYKVEKCKPFPMADQIGSITLQAMGSETKVTWTSKGRVALPLFGKWFDKKIQHQGAKGFASILKQVETVA